MFAIFKCVLETFWHFDHASWRKEIQTEIIFLMHFGKSNLWSKFKTHNFCCFGRIYGLGAISIIYSLFLMDQISKLLAIYCPNNNNLLRLRDGSHSQELWTFGRFFGNESFFYLLFSIYGGHTIGTLDYICSLHWSTC